MWFVIDSVLLLVPVAGFVFQHQQIARDRRATFSTQWSLWLLVAHVLSLLFCFHIDSSSASAALAVHSVASVVVQLLLVRVVTRVATEQRMLPSTLFRRLSLRWKNFRRYFWEWDDFASYAIVVALFGAIAFAVVWVLSLVVPAAALQWTLAATAWTVEAGAVVPQILRNRVEGVDGLSPVMIGCLLIGDVVKTVRFRATETVFLLLGCAQLTLHFYLAFQWFTLRRTIKIHHN